MAGIEHQVGILGGAQQGEGQGAGDVVIHPPPAPASAHFVPVGVQHRGRDAPTHRDFVAVLSCPLTDRGVPRSVRVWRLRATAPAGASPTATAGAASTSSADEGGEGVAELAGVLLGQFDLVHAPVEAEGHRLGGLGPVEVIHQPHTHSPCHGPRPIREVPMPSALMVLAPAPFATVPDPPGRSRAVDVVALASVISSATVGLTGVHRPLERPSHGQDSSTNQRAAKPC